jgi:hypothetical protein
MLAYTYSMGTFSRLLTHGNHYFAGEKTIGATMMGQWL